MTPAERRAILDDYPVVPESTQPSVQISLKTAGRNIILKDGARAIELHLLVDGETLRAVFSDNSFGKDLSAQGIYAEELGGRMATPEENCAVADALSERKTKGTSNQAETKLLDMYRQKYVRDSKCGRGITLGCLQDHFQNQFADPDCGALFILPLAES